MLNKSVHDILHIASFGGSGIKFAVGIGSGTTLTKAPVAIGVNLLCSRQVSNVAFPIFHGFSSLKNDRLQSQLQSSECRKNTGRTCSNDDDGRTVVAVFVLPLIVGGYVFLANIHLGLGVISDFAPTGVEAAAKHLNVRNITCVQA